MTQGMWVADISDECILGLDFLESHGCQVNLKDGALIIGGEEIPLERSNMALEPACYKAILLDDVCLPPLSEMVLPVKVETTGSNARWGVLGQSTAQEVSVSGVSDCLLVGRTLVDLYCERTPLRVMNLSSQQQKIPKGTELAECELVSGVFMPMVDTVGEPSGCVRGAGTINNLPDHLRDLYERSVVGLSTPEQEEVYQFLTEFSDLFSSGPQDLGCTDLVQHRINTGQTPPIRQPPRRLPLAKREEAEMAVQEMQKHGVIEPASSPWSSPVVLVKKKDGSTRFCVDYRKLNAVTYKDSYPLPRVDDTLEALAGAKWFSTLDLKSGYWQVKLDDRDKKSAFSTGSGLWQFKVMPFGPCNAPATFERLMEQVLAGLPLSTALVYLDDILVPGRSFAHQMCNLRVVFQRLRKAKLKLSPKKCTLFQKKVKYLGHIVDETGVSPDPGKVEAITSWPTPHFGLPTFTI